MIEIVAIRLDSMVVAEVPKLASAAKYFFKMGVILLLAIALNVQISKQTSEGVVDMFSTTLRLLVSFMMMYWMMLIQHVGFDKKINKGKLVNMNIEILTIMMMQLAVLAGDFLLFRACITLASLKNTEVSTILLH
uniref:Uncharacterized protein n=1 Tax=Lactuca sativa TaxID=4236 RepID=A0A9R1XJ83_LACSA|nr:hypothetical protein LSAT_V11C300143760 [Lactuca sativa]